MRIIFSIIFLLFSSIAAHAGLFKGVSYQVEGSETVAVLEFETLDAAKLNVFELPGEFPRVVIDVSDGTGKTLSYAGSGHVKEVRAASREDGMRLVLDLEKKVRFFSQEVEGNRLKVAVLGQNTQQSSTNDATAEQDRFFKDTIPYPRLQPREQRTPVIVIDAGHGGRDPGAVGQGGTLEKDVTLKAAVELQKQLAKTGHYDVILTRGGDKYIKHGERLRIARAGGADLFISIHADSTTTSRPRGASVYTLADRSKNRSKGIVNSQNWIMDVDLSEQSDPVGDILVDLAQRKTFSQSSLFADILIDELGKTTKLIGNTHRRAGYYVLLAPDVPAVLLELGFLSNEKDEKLLKSTSHRKKVMGSVVKAINTYFDNQKS